MKWNIDIIENWDAIWNEEFQSRWLKLLDESPNGHVFYHPALVKAWIDTYRSIWNLKLIFVWGNFDGIDVILPLVHWSKNWKNAFQKVIIPIGHTDYDYHDPIFSQDVDNEMIQEFYIQLLCILKQKFSFDEFFMIGIHEQYIPAIFSVEFEEPCPFINIANHANWDAYLDSLNKKFVRDFYRTKQNIENQKDVSYFICDDIEDYEKVSKFYPLMLQYHAQRWPDAYKAPHFHENLIRYGLQGQVLSFCVVFEKEKLVASYITFYFKNKMYLYMPTMNTEYNPYSPGRLSLACCIEDAFKKQLSIVDHLRGAELYKGNWSSDHDTVYNVIYFQKQFSSKFKKAILFLRNKLLTLLGKPV